MSPMNPTHTVVAHYRVSARALYPLCGIYSAIRMTDDPTLVTCKRCRKAINRQIAQMLDEMGYAKGITR